MRPLDQRVRDLFTELSGSSMDQDNPRLIQFLQEHMIDPPRPFVRKISHPLYKTPQAQEVDKILKGKVSMGYTCQLEIDLNQTNY